MKAWIRALSLLSLLLSPAAAQDAPDPSAAAEPVRLGGFRAQLDGLDQPSAIAISPENEIWVAERWGGALCVYDEKGALVRRMLAEIPPNLKLREPRGLAIGEDGTVYVADGRRVVGFGWDGERGRHTGLKTAITYALVEPLGLCVDRERLYVADAGLQLVVIFDRRNSKLVGAIGGFGGEDGQFRRPVDVAIDEEGQIYVADQGNQRVQRFDKDGRFLGAFGGFGAHAGLFAAPSSIEYAAGRVYVADRDNQRIQVFDREGKALYDWGVHALVPHEGQGHLHYPDALALAPDGSFAAVGEGFEDRVQLFGPEDDASRLLRAGSQLTGAAHYGGGLALGARLCVVLEPSTPCGLALDTNGSEPIEIARFGRLGEGPGKFSSPVAVALDARERAWVCDPGLARLSIFALDRPAQGSQDYDPFLPRFVESFDFEKLDGGTPIAVALDATGRSCVLEARGDVLVFAPDFAGPIERRQAPKQAVAPCAIAVSPDGARILVADPSAHALHVLEHGESVWKTHVLAADALQPRPSGVAIASDGEIFVTDEQRHEVVEFSPALERVASFGARGLGRAQFEKPRGIAIDAQGRLWVLDLGNHRVQVLSRKGEFVQAFGSRLFTDPTRQKAGK
ncbi:MAG: NHL repeat-containing protein [Planctomycetes bacterium]|nr:NHL repeat-containing protein [Planctomycetota bacterium]